MTDVGAGAHRAHLRPKVCHFKRSSFAAEPLEGFGGKAQRVPVLQDVTAKLADNAVVRILEGRCFTFRNRIAPRLLRPGELALQLGKLLYLSELVIPCEIKRPFPM